MGQRVLCIVHGHYLQLSAQAMFFLPAGSRPADVRKGPGTNLPDLAVYGKSACGMVQMQQPLTSQLNFTSCAGLIP